LLLLLLVAVLVGVKVKRPLFPPVNGEWRGARRDYEHVGEILDDSFEKAVRVASELQIK
jgi:hypothetical protein